jgi:hypothetical protein
MGVKQKKDPESESKPSVFGCTFNLESLTIRSKATTPWEDVILVLPQRGL